MHMYIGGSEITVGVEIVDPNLSRCPKVRSNQNGIELILLTKALCVYMQGLINKIDSSGHTKFLTYNTGNAFTRETIKEIRRRLQCLRTPVAGARFSSRLAQLLHPQLPIFLGGRALGWHDT